MKKINPSESLVTKIIEQDERKISFRRNFKIIEADKTTDHLVPLLKSADWNQTGKDLWLLVKLSESGNYIAGVEKNEEFYALGSAMTIETGKQINWIGMVLVNPMARQHGIAFELLIRCLMDIRNSLPLPVIGLDATPQGKYLYKKLGFETSFIINRCILRAVNRYQIEDQVNISMAESINKIEQYLKSGKLTKYLPHYKKLFQLSEGSSFIYTNNNKILGFIFSRKGRKFPFIGPLVADSLDIAKKLITATLKYWRNKNQSEILMDIPSVHMLRMEVASETGNNGKNKMNGVDFSNINIQQLRSFERMYHFVDEKNKNRIAKYIIDKKGLKKIEESQISDMLNKSVECNAKTRKYIQWEREKLLPFLYGTGGPEFS